MTVRDKVTRYLNAETRVTSLSPGRAIVPVRRMKTGATATTVR
jgi:hypothetical protein